MASHLRSERDFERQLGFLEQAKKEGKLVYEGERDIGTKRMGFSIVKLGLDGVGEKGGLVEEEIFGPVLPIIPISSIDKAIEWINARPHPLAVYVCSGRKSIYTKVVNETISGSATWNDFGFATLGELTPHSLGGGGSREFIPSSMEGVGATEGKKRAVLTSARSLPFGGVGGSGWGAYHGYDGFMTFTHTKSTLQIPYFFEPLMSLRYPPISNTSQKILRLLLSTPLPNRPVSVEDEERKLRRARWIGRGRRTGGWMLVLVVSLVLAGTLGGVLGRGRGGGGGRQ